MNKLTKLLSVFVIAGAIGAGVAGVAGCKKSNGHSHKYNYTVDVEDATKHNGVCDCGKNPILKQDHVDTKDNDGICDLCGAPVNPQGGEETTVTSVTVSAADGATSVAVEGKLQLSATVSGTGSPAQTVTWKSSDDTKAIVNASTGEVTGVAEGTVTITATSTVDTSKSGTINLTVTAKGTVDPGPGPVEKTIYDTLMERSDKLTYLDAGKFTEGTKLPDLQNYTTKGIYFRAQTGGSTAPTDPKRDYVEVIKEGTDLALQQYGSDGKTTGLPNVYTEIVTGAVSGTVEGYFETKISKLATGEQDFINFKDGENSIFKITLNGGKVKYKVGAGAETACDAEATVAENQYVNVYFKLDKDAGKVTVKFGDAVILNEKAIDIGAFNCIELASSNKGQRAHTTKKIVVCGAELTLDQFKESSKASLKAAYDKYPLETEYQTNGTHLTKAYEDGVKAIEAAADNDGVSAAHAAAVAAMKAILKDSEIAAARSAATVALENKFPYADYSYTIAQDNPNSKYNNKAIHESEMNAYKAEILSATLKSEMDEIVANATISVGNDAAQLLKKQNDAIAELKAYVQETDVAEAIAGLSAEDKARVDAILAETGEGSGIAAIKATVTIQGAQQEFDEAKKGIDRIIENSNLSIEEIIANYNRDLDAYIPTRAYKDTDKIDLNGSQTVVDLFNAAKLNGKNEIAKAKDITTGINDQKIFALNEYNNAIAAIELIAKKNFRLNNEDPEQGVRVYIAQAKAKVENADLLAMFNDITEDDIINADTTGKVILAVQKFKFDVDLILKKNEACFGEGETDKPSTYGLEKYFNIKFAAAGLRDEDKEALYNKIYQTNFKAVYDVSANSGDDIGDDTVVNAVFAKVTQAAADAKVAIDSEIAALKSAVFTVTVIFNGYSDAPEKTVHVRYGDTLTKESIFVTGMTVTALYGEDGNEITEGVNIYADTTVKVNVSDENLALSSTEYAPVGSTTQVTDVTDSKVLDDTLLTVSVPDGSKIYKAGYKWTDSSNKEKTFGQVAIKNSSGTEVKYDNALTIGNIPTNTDNSLTPLTIYAKSALSSLKVYVKLAGSNGTDGRSGNTYYKINGGTAVERAGIDTVLEISDIKAGDVIQVYIKNTNKSGGNMWVTKVEATADTTETPKLVTVQWQNEDGTVWKTTQHSYLETITAPEGSPTVTSGAHTGWKLNDEAFPAEGKQLASSPTAYVVTPTVSAPDVTVHFTDGTTTFDELYLTSATTNALPQERNASATNMFLGWYVQTGETPADTDVLFDIENLTAGEYNVYAKYLVSSITVNYSTGTTDNLFILDGKVVKADKTAAELPADPTSDDPENSEFKGWFYTPAGGEETQFTAEVLASLTAGEYTVTAKFGASSAKTMLFNSAAVVDNSVTDADGFITISKASSGGENLSIKDRTVTIGDNGVTKYLQGKAMDIKTGDKSVKLKIYCALSNSSGSSKQSGTITATGMAAANYDKNTDYVMIEVEIDANSTVTLTPSGSNRLNVLLVEIAPQ